MVEVFSSHPKDHARTSAIFDSSVASKLEKVVKREESCNVVSILLDVLNQLNSLFDLGIVSLLNLALEPKSTLGTSARELIKECTYTLPLRLKPASYKAALRRWGICGLM
jgi:hypothetical protein